MGFFLLRHLVTVFIKGHLRDALVIAVVVDQDVVEVVCGNKPVAGKQILKKVI